VQLQEHHPESRIVVLGGRGEPHSVTAALAAGADGYLDKATSGEVLIRSLDLIMLSQKVVHRRYCRPCARVVRGVQRTEDSHWEDESLGLLPLAEVNNVPSQMRDAFSDREAAVLVCLMRGDSNKGIARHLSMAEATVKVLVKAILRKVRAKNRTQAAIWAASHLSDDGKSANGGSGALGLYAHREPMDDITPF